MIILMYSMTECLLFENYKVNREDFLPRQSLIYGNFTTVT